MVFLRFFTVPNHRFLQFRLGFHRFSAVFRGSSLEPPETGSFGTVLVRNILNLNRTTVKKLTISVRVNYRFRFRTVTGGYGFSFTAGSVNFGQVYLQLRRCQYRSIHKWERYEV